MTVNPDASACRGLLLVRNQDQFDGLRKWLTAWAAHEERQCVLASADATPRQQGRAKVLLELLEAVNAAPAVLEKLNRP